MLSIGFSFVIAPFTLILLKLIPSYSANYLPSGPTPAIFTLLALYHDMIPSVYKFKLLSSSPSRSAQDQPPSILSTTHSITLSDKIFVYILASHLSLSQFPASTICAFSGWFVGVLWSREVLPLRNFRISQKLWDAALSKGSASLAALSTTPNHASGIAELAAAAAAAEVGAQQQQQTRQDATPTTETTAATGVGGGTGAGGAGRTQGGRGFGSQLLDTFRSDF